MPVIRTHLPAVKRLVCPDVTRVTVEAPALVVVNGRDPSKAEQTLAALDKAIADAEAAKK